MENIDYKSELRSAEVAFFFGAGASIEAGVPDTAGLMSDFVESLSSEKAIPVRRFLKKLEDWARTQNPPTLLDVELLLMWRIGKIAFYPQPNAEITKRCGWCLRK